MRYLSITGLGVVALMLSGAPASTYADSMGPSAAEKVERTSEGLGSKVKDTAREAKSEVTDAWVNAKAKIALFSDDRAKGRQVSVETRDGVVTLRGKVDSEQAKMAAAQTVKGVEHVKGVRNELQVVDPAERKQVDTDDKAIMTMVEQRLKKDPELKSAKINARVDSGIVTITGEVKSLMISSRASEILSDVPGVRAVRNDLTYAPRTSQAPAAAAPAGSICEVERTRGQQLANRADGRVVKVDRAAGKVTLRQPDGRSHEYLASQAAMQDLKEGDRLEITVKQPGTC
jgi:hyperosmotically inducible protein